jgi:transglutaminase-like putative cysteine protease
MEKELNPEVLLLLLSAVGLIVLPHVAHIPFSLTALFFCLWIWRMLAVWQPRFLPQGWAVVLVILIGAVLLASQYQGVFGREIGTSVFVLALGVKLLELNKSRDVYLISYLTLIVVASQFLFQQTVVMLIYSFLVCSLLLASLMTINSVNSRPKAAIRAAMKLIFQALPLAAVLFVLSPRFHPPKWTLISNNSNQAKSGLGETLDPGSISELAVSKQLVFRAKFEDESPPKNQLYWRGPVFTFTDGAVWRMSDSEYVVDYQDRLKYSGKAYAYTELLEPQSHNWVYALDMPARLDDALQRKASYQLISRNKTGEAAEYSLVSYPHYNTGYITKTEYRENLQLPADPSPRIFSLIEDLQGFHSQPEVFIERLLEYFRAQHFKYTLKPPLMQEHFIETFLFEAKSGFCNHYATSVAYLLRVAGIPARVVSGYQGGELNPIGGFLEVRQANAHIWVEAWLEGKGWHRVDPTAAIMPERIDQDVDVQAQAETGVVSLEQTQAQQAENSSKLQEVRQLFNDADYQWQRWVVSYSGYTQSLLLGNMGVGGRSRTQIVYWALSVLLLFMLILAGVLLRFDRRRLEAPELKAYRQFCTKMAKAGVAIKVGEGAHDFALRAKLAQPELADLIDDISASFIRLRYLRFHSSKDLRLLKKRVRRL